MLVLVDVKSGGHGRTNGKDIVGSMESSTHHHGEKLRLNPEEDRRE